MDSGVKKKRSQAPHSALPGTPRVTRQTGRGHQPTPIEKNGCSVHGARGSGASGG